MDQFILFASAVVLSGFLLIPLSARLGAPILLLVLFAGMLLVTPSALGKTLLPALAIAAILMFVARPLAVFACTFPFRYSFRERFYLSWVGLRGAVPIFLAIVPVITPGPVTIEFFNIVFVVVVTSLIFQGWTVAASTRWLKVDDPQAV